MVNAIIVPQIRGSILSVLRSMNLFLIFSKEQGNDLSTPRPEYNFPGLNPGDRWCLCAQRWLEAAEAGCAPPVILESTHERALDIISLSDLTYHQLQN